MIKGILGIAAAAAIVVLAASYSNVFAEPAQKAAAHTAVKEEFQCKNRQDCPWVAAVVDSKTGKEKRKAYCRRAPKKK